MKRYYWITLVVILIVIAAGAGAAFWLHQRPAPAPPQEAAAPPPPSALAVPAKPAGTTFPSFDAVNVGPDGTAVIAGRAAPGSDVTVLAGGNELGHAKADANGEFVIMTEKPLPPGPQSLTLSARQGDEPPVSSSSSLALVVPEHGAAQPPVAVVLPPTGAARTLGGAPRAPRHLVLDLVEYDADGTTVLTGRADPGARVTVSIDGHQVASLKANAKGDWTTSLAASVVATGRYHLAITGKSADGADAGAIALDMRRPASGEAAGNELAIVPGNNLWRLAERSYGAGLRYVEIYRANRAQIENPNMIYPGQVLALPADRNP
jgi:nucleoid-associated protein YgaU